MRQKGILPKLANFTFPTKFIRNNYPLPCILQLAIFSPAHLLMEKNNYSKFFQREKQGQNTCAHKTWMTCNARGKFL